MRAHTSILRIVALGALATLFSGGTNNVLGADPVLNLEPVPEGLKISWSAADGRDYVLQGSDDLLNWTNVDLSLTQTGSLTPDAMNQVLVPTGKEYQMYRLMNDGEQKQAAYVGAMVCRNCHGNKYNEWVNSGHPYKLNKVVDAQPPKYFGDGVVNVPTPPEGVDWEDVSYVIGGALWKGRFIDQEGYIITGTNVQYNLATKGWVAYHATDPVGTKPYDCGACHTTGWKSLDQGSVHQDALPGMHGSWAATGIECEACHGPGSRHVDAPFDEKEDEIVKDKSSAMCGACHHRGAIDTIPASGGFIRHHEQYNEMLSAGHKNHQCVTCHDPHKSVKVGAEDGIIRDCTVCHKDSKYQADFHNAFASCVDCHMPKASKSAVAENKHTGDLHTHIFKINPAADGQMFTPDGGFAIGSTGVTLDFVCYKCHTDPDGVGGGGSTKTMEELSAKATGFHD